MQKPITHEERERENFRKRTFLVYGNIFKRHTHLRANGMLFKWDNFFAREASN